MGSPNGGSSKQQASKERSFAAIAAATGASASAATGLSTIGGAIWSVLLLGTMVATNMLALYSLSISRDVQRNLLMATDSPQPSSMSTLSILNELAALKEELRRTQKSILEQKQEQLQNHQELEDHHQSETTQIVQSPELIEFTAQRILPLGRNPNYGLDNMVSPIGHECYAHKDLLQRYMSYNVGEVCPDDWSLGQSLMLRGCEPLPRRRCFARTPPHVAQPYPLPDSLWRDPPDESVLWSQYACKNFHCLKNRAKNSTVFYDCADCFDLTGPESYRWVNSRDRHDFMSLEDIIALKKGTIRIGLDIGGGSGSFAARMWEHNVTIVTSTLNLNGPFNEFVALRGLLPLYITISQRLPFFDNTLDLVHTMHVLSNWLPLESLQFVLFDIDRVLRPGGLFWLDHFFCTKDQLEAVYVPLIEKLRFTKIKWVVGKKLDRNGIVNREVYLSALLEKPIRD